jgi:ribose transport system ATP-binding protein
MTRLRMEQIRKSFGATVALEDVSLEVRAGEVHALIGENGAGKSTLMKILAGAQTPDHGQIWLDGQRYQPRDPRAGRHAGVAMIYQELSLAPHLSVMDNIMLGNETARWGWLREAEMEQRARSALAQLGREEIDPRARVSALSLADQQLVEVARSVALGCKILVLDEPTSSITARDVEKLFQLIRRLREQGLAIVYISHFLEEIQQISDRFTVLRDGRTVATGRTADTTRDQIIRQMVGRNVAELYPRTPRAPGEVLLRVENVTGVRMPRHASLDLRRGEVLGIAGLIGSGRTELLRAIFGLDAVVAGEVRVAYWRGGGPRQMWNRNVGMVSEDRKQEGLALNRSIADNLTLPWLRGLGPVGLVWPRRQQAVCLPWIEQLQIRCQGPKQAVGDLSGGNQQKVAIARLLHADCDVLLLDEPTRGVDVGSKSEIYRLIDQLVAAERSLGDAARGVLMVSSYLPELLGVCDRIAVMSRGSLHPPRAARDRNEHEMMLEAVGAGDAGT